MEKKILVIEDEIATRTNLVKFLEAEGFDSIGAENGDIGIKLAQEHLPDLIICDILMPDLDGYDVLTQLQQNAATAAIPFIFLTSATDSASLRQGMDMGADDYLSKPITSAELRRAILSRLKKQEVKIEQFCSESQPVKELTKKVEKLEQYIDIQDRMLNNLSQGLKQSLSEINQSIEIVKSLSRQKEHDHEIVGVGDQSKLATISDRYLDNIQQEFARILALVNQVSELKRIITPDNTKMLNQFNFLDGNIQNNNPSK